MKNKPKVDVLQQVGEQQLTSLGGLPAREGGVTVVVITTVERPRRSLKER